MANLITLTRTNERSAHQITWLILLGAVLMFLILQFGVTFLASVMDMTWSALINTATMLVFALAFEHLVFARRPVESLRALGWRKANLRATLVAVILSVA